MNLLELINKKLKDANKKLNPKSALDEHCRKNRCKIY